jgi:hypothetical protein
VTPQQDSGADCDDGVFSVDVPIVEHISLGDTGTTGAGDSATKANAMRCLFVFRIMSPELIEVAVLESVNTEAV